MGKPSDLIQGTLDLLILKTVALEPKHGWAIGKRIQQISNDVLQITQGSQRIAKVPREVVGESDATCVAAFFRDARRRTELAHRRRAGLSRRHASRDVLVGLFVDVHLELALQPPIDGPTPEQ